MRVTFPKDIPLGTGENAKFLPVIIAIMVFIASLMMMVSLYLDRIGDVWQEDFAGKITIQIPAPMLDRDSAGDHHIKRTLDILLSTPGVQNVEVIEQEEAISLLKPWLGTGILLDGLPVPSLLAVRVSPKNFPGLERLQTELEAVVPGVIVDDHHVWIEDVLQLVDSVKFASFLIIVLAFGTTLVCVFYVTRTAMSIHSYIIELLHIIGAEDAYLARRFQWHAFIFGLLGGLGGLMGAAFIAAVLWVFATPSNAGFFSSVPIKASDIAWLFALPLLVAIASLITARITVLKTLLKFP